MKEHFLRLFEYNSWANLRVIDSLKEAPLDECLKHFGHIIAAQDIWLCRLRNKDWSDIEVWPSPSSKEIQALSTQSSSSWQKFISSLSLDDFAECYTYADTQGTQCETVCADAIVHVINHSTHHRAQIALLLRQQGVQPPQTDYTYFSRLER